MKEALPYLVVFLLTNYSLFCIFDLTKAGFYEKYYLL